MTQAATAAPERSEFEMGLNRFAFCLVVIAYLIVVNGPALRLELMYMGGFFLFSLGLFLHIRHVPRPISGRAVVALVADLSTISFEMHAGGATTSVLYPIYLWVILGNGFRFGLRFLFMAMATAIAGFGLVCRTTPFWLHEHYLWIGLTVGLIIVPGYGATLIAKLSSARRDAEAASQAKSMFLASVSHSVRTPLNAILGSVGLLEDSATTEEQKELVQQIKIGSDILMSLVSSILDFSQIEANRMPMRLSEVDIGALVLKLRLLVAPQARAAGLELFVHIGPDVPGSILSDPRHLHEILVNLVSNALKFTESGKVTLAVTAMPLAEDRVRLRIDVSDTGIGIQEDALERIFESFTQADGSIIDRFGGTGLGLATVRRLVLLLGGTIDVTSVLGEGSAFSVRLDCAVAPGLRDADTAVLVSRIVLLSPEGGNSRLAGRLAELSASLVCVTQAGELAAHLQVGPAGTSNTLLVLDAPSRAERDTLVPLLAELDPGGDLPRLLVASGIGPDEIGLLTRHVSSWIGEDCSPDGLRAAIRRCVLPPAAAAPASDAPPIPMSPGLDILVADDNLTNQKLVEKILERAGHRAHLVQNGEDAVIALTERHFDLALLDLNMPVMGGLDAAKEYRFLSLGQKSVPLIALTADATPDTAARCLEAGMIACITKPITPAELIARIHGLVASPNRAAEAASVVSDIRSHPQFYSVRTPLDLQVMADLERLGGRDFAVDLLDGFIVEARALGMQIANAAANDDLMSFRNHAHALRSAAANVGASVVHDLCGQCRDMPPAHLAGNGAALARRIGAAVDRVAREMPDRGHARRS